MLLATRLLWGSIRRASLVGAATCVFAVTAFTIIPAETSADIQPQTTCSAGNAFSVVLPGGMPSGDIYVRLANDAKNTSSVTAYYQPLSAVACHKLGSVAAKASGWSKLAASFVAPKGGGYLTIIGPGLSAGPYQAAAELLIVEGNTCRPTTDCSVTYQGRQGTLQPRQLTGATDQISVFAATPIRTVGYSSVEYYSGVDYLYVSRSLAPVNQNYLDGGKHQVQTLVHLNNGETVAFSQSIDAGTDYTGAMWLRSTFYRSSGAARVIFLAITAVVSIAFIVAALGAWLQLRRWRRKHGLANYRTNFTKPKSTIKVG